MIVGQTPVKGDRLWTRTLDRITRVGLLESMVSRMAEPPPKTTQDRIQMTNT